MGRFTDPIRKFIKPDPNEVGPSGYTSLQYAIADNNIQKARSLIKAGADLNLRGEYQEPPLHMALKRDRYSITLALIEAGADPNLQDTLGLTPLHVAVKQNQETFVLALLKLNADPNIKDSSGATALHRVQPYAVLVAQTLIKNGARVNEQDAKGNTPLHFFIDYPGMIERLLANGANPNLRNKDGHSALTLMVDERKMTRYPKPLQKLIAEKADLSAAGTGGETFMHLAARLELEEAFFTASGRADFTLRDNQGNNVLHSLAATQNVQMMRKVLERAPETITQINHDGLTPLEALLRRTPSTDAYRRNPSGLEQAQRKWVSSVDALLDHKADPDSTDSEGKSVLHHAVLHNSPLLLEEALLKGADPNLKDNEGKCALQYAIAANNLKAMDILLDRGANPDMPDSRGWTILDRLAEAGDRDSPIVQRLIVGSGQYQKQLPLYPELMRRPRTIDKGHPAIEKQPRGKPGPKL